MTAGRFLRAALLLLPLVAACQRTGGPAPVTNVANTPDSVGGAVIVGRGDSAYTLSRRYNVPLRDLIEANHLNPPYTLEIGQRLVLPGSRQYVVQRGDTLYGISRMFSVDVSELTRINKLSPPYAVQVGQPLRLPSPDHFDGSAMADAAPVSGPSMATAPVKQVSRGGAIQATELPPPGGSPAPAPGEPAAVSQGQLHAPAQSQPQPSGIAVAPIPLTKPGGAPESNGGAVAQDGTVYQPGQAPSSLHLPGQKPAPRTDSASQPPSAPSPAQQEVAAATPPAAAAAVAPPPKSDAAPAPRGSSRFLWPVKGKLISTFGPKPDGLHNDGLNIAAAKGTPVAAADNGVVAYAGNELRGFGNLLLVKHADGFITAYAHLDRIDVERGASVKRGQIIGSVGQTGSVTSPQLHFELRKGSQAVDPRDRMEPARGISEGASRDAPPGPG